MPLSTLPTELLRLIVRSEYFEDWPIDASHREDFNNRRGVCKLWKAILDDVLVSDDAMCAFVEYASQSMIIDQLSKLNPAVLEREQVLLLSAGRDHDAVVRLILEGGTGPDPQLYDQYGNEVIVLNKAVQYSHEPTVRLLLDHGADTQRSQDGWTALHEATSESYRGRPSPSCERSKDHIQSVEKSLWHPTKIYLPHLSSILFNPSLIMPRTPLRPVTGNSRKGKEISSYMRGQIVGLHQAEISQNQIRKLYEISRGGVQYTLDQNSLREDGKSLSRTGRPKKLLKRDKRRVMSLIKRDLFLTYRDILREIDLNVFSRILRNMLKESEYGN